MASSILVWVMLSLQCVVYANIIIYTKDIPHTIVEEFRDMPASFGDDLPPDGLRGFLIQGVPENGCSAIAPPPAVENFTGKWIVLLARYNCSFDVKVRNAQMAGYDCAIVHNVDSNDLETMSAKDPDGIIIPSVFISDQAGRILSEDYLYPQNYYIMVNGDLPFDINTHLLLPFAIVVVLCLLVILVFMIVKCIKDRRAARRHRLPNRSLKKIPTCRFGKGDPYDTCAICLDDYQEGERLRVLPCAHAYHAACIDPWLTQNKRVCPVCKRRVLVAGERRRVHDTDSGGDSSDTEPLLQDTPATPATQGGTFDEQRENPFVRAARFARGLLREREPLQQDRQEPPREDVDQSTQSDEENVDTSDRQPLVQPTVATVSNERSRQRRRRARSATGRPRRAGPDLRPDAHSINNESVGEIGVAALPASPLASTSAPHNVHL